MSREEVAWYMPANNCWKQRAVQAIASNLDSESSGKYPDVYLVNKRNHSSKKTRIKLPLGMTSAELKLNAVTLNSAGGSLGFTSLRLHSVVASL